MSKTDLTFITNDGDSNLQERFKVLIKDTQFFDVLAGYFYASGFHALYKALEATEKIRILIGINTSRESYELIQQGQKQRQQYLQFSHAETKQEVEGMIQQEMKDSEDKKEVEEGIAKFIEWIKMEKMEIKAYPSQDIHAKLYIMSFVEDDKDTGRVITGSSNFSKSGMVDNLEFNVELKNFSDYEFAKNKFEELWQRSVDVSEKYVQTINDKTWLSQNITPYQLYLKFLYEYFKDELSRTDEVFTKYLPEEFMELEYQQQAVLNAKKILEEYGGVFISDVVGLGKTYIATMLAGQIEGRTLVIAPPALLEKSNPGSWENAFRDFRVAANFESVGKLAKILDSGVEQFSNIIIDEAHRFRNETNKTYEMLAEICRGKRVILVTATPYNNTPSDILSQIKLFQNARKSTIPNLPNIEEFIRKRERRLKKLDRKSEYPEYIRVSKQNAKEIREKILKYLMVRRTRTEVANYFSKDLEKKGLKFPDIEKPVPFFYELNDDEDSIFSETIQHVTQDFKYSRYTPLLYFTGKVGTLEKQSQKNMGAFMKTLLVKRLESSFFAFRKTVARFIKSYEMAIREYDKGNVYVSKDYSGKIFDLLEKDDDEEIQRLVDEEKAQRYTSEQFTDKYREDLQSDLDKLKKIKEMWESVKRDPKLLKFIAEIKEKKVLRENKIILFTESKETAYYLQEGLNKELPENILCFTGESGEPVREKVIENFDARARHPKDDYRILISTEILAEGVNLHRSNVIVNYDIPWNPTRMMQRVGRVNRVDTAFDTIHTFNFFPTKQSNDEIKLKENAESKINSFLTLLGGDAELLTEGEPVGSHELFNRLVSKMSVTEEEGESELKYLRVIEDLRDNDPEMFERIKRLPKKARTGKSDDENQDALITYFRRGKLQKFYIARRENDAEELDFMATASLLESAIQEKRRKLGDNFYELLDKNKEAFLYSTNEEVEQAARKRGVDSAARILKILKATSKNTQQFTDDQEEYLEKAMHRLQEGALPKQTAKETFKALDKLGAGMANPFKVLATLQNNIPARLLESHYAEENPQSFGKREVILSMYLEGNKNGE